MMMSTREREGSITELVFQIQVGELQLPMEVLVVGLQVIHVFGVCVVIMSDEHGTYNQGTKLERKRTDEESDTPDDI